MYCLNAACPDLHCLSVFGSPIKASCGCAAEGVVAQRGASSNHSSGPTHVTSSPPPAAEKDPWLAGGLSDDDTAPGRVSAAKTGGGSSSARSGTHAVGEDPWLVSGNDSEGSLDRSKKPKQAGVRRGGSSLVPEAVRQSLAAQVLCFSSSFTVNATPYSTWFGRPLRQNSK